MLHRYAIVQAIIYICLGNSIATTIRSKYLTISYFPNLQICKARMIYKTTNSTIQQLCSKYNSTVFMRSYLKNVDFLSLHLSSSNLPIGLYMVYKVLNQSLKYRKFTVNLFLRHLYGRMLEMSFFCYSTSQVSLKLTSTN